MKEGRERERIKRPCERWLDAAAWAQVHAQVWFRAVSVQEGKIEANHHHYHSPDTRQP